MDIRLTNRKDIGAYGEKVASEYLRRQGFIFVDKNVARKTGEIDLIVKKENTLHFVEVKTVLCEEFPTNKTKNVYDPSMNLHDYKIHKVSRTSEWYMAELGWEGECQIDGVLVWIRKRDTVARVRYIPQIL